MAHLEANNISAVIHYPIPPHLSQAYQYLHIPKGSLPATEEYAETVLSLPIYDGMTEEEVFYTADVINRF